MVSRKAANATSLDQDICLAVNSCLRPLASLHGWNVTTVEGLRDQEQGAAVQTRISHFNGSQCGFCTPGMVVSLCAQFHNEGGNGCSSTHAPSPPTSKTTKESLARSLDGNLCRCTGYRPILDAAASFLPAAADLGDLEDMTEKLKCLVMPRGGSEKKESRYDVGTHAEAVASLDLMDAPSSSPSYLVFEGTGGDRWYQPHDLVQLFLVLSWHPEACLIAGNTGRSGVYKQDKELDDAAATAAAVNTPVVLVSLQDVGELHGHTWEATTGWLEVGAGLTLSDLVDILKSLPETAFSSSTLRDALLAHLQCVAGTLVRNAGSLGGNLYIAKSKHFDSDLSTLMGGLGAMVRVAWGPGRAEEDLPWLDYLNRKEDEDETEEEARPRRDILLRLRFRLRDPRSGEKVDVFQSYRAALRKGNSHAFANAAFRATIDSVTGRLESVSLCMGALGMPALRSKDAEEALLSASTDGVAAGTDPLGQASLEAALLALRKELVPANKTRYRYRVQLLSGFLYKFFLYLKCQVVPWGYSSPSLDARLLSAATVPDVPVALKSSEQTYTRRWMTKEGEASSSNSNTTENDHLPFVALPKDYQGFQASGQAVYVSDVPELDGTLFGAYVKSPRSVGVLTELQVSAAKAMPGVVAVLTAADIPGTNDCAFYFGSPDAAAPDTVFVPLGGRVRFHSQPLALVVATSTGNAQMAAKLVEAVFDGFEAPLVTISDAREAGSSMGIMDGVKRGNAMAVLARARLEHQKGLAANANGGVGKTLRVVEGSLRAGSQKHFYLETQTAYAVPDEGRMLVYSSTQAPQAVQEVVARVLGTPMNTIQVKMRRAGGAFGAKATRNLPHAAAAAVAAKVLARPVRLTLDRVTDMQLTGGRHAMEAEYAVAYDPVTGLLEAVACQVWLNGGFCADLSFTPCHDLAANLEQAYFIPHFDASIEVLRTNLPTSTAMRGPGVVQASFIMESILNHVAADLADRFTPEEVRRVNFFRPVEEGSDTAPKMMSAGCMHMPPMPISHFTLPDIWQKLSASAQLEARREEVVAFNEANRWRKRGVAMTPIKFLSALMPMQATVNAYSDGSILIHHGGCEIGQGIHAKSALVALRALAQIGVVDPPTLSMVQFADTDTDAIPNGGYTAASTTSERACAAVDAACQEMVKRLTPLRDRLLQEKENKAAAAAACACAATKGNNGGHGGGCVVPAPLTWVELVKTALGFRESIDLCCHAQWRPGQPGHYHNYGAALTEVEVDVLTGEVTIRAVHLLYDCGKSINPAADLGQVEGAFVQGLGYYLMEEAVIATDGALQSPGTWDYKPPLLADMPAEWKVALLENGEFDKGFLSSKASGEPPLVLATSVMMALRHAVAAARKEVFGSGSAAVHSFRLDAPATPERVHRACGATMGCFSLNGAAGAQPWLDATPRHHVDVAVAGAGLGGLALAIALDKLGVSAALFERAPALRDVSQGLVGITPNGLRALELIDPRLKEYLMERGKYNTEAFTKTVDEQGQSTERVVQFEANNVSIPWADIQHSLARLVPRAMIQCSHDFAGFDEDENGVTIYFKGRVETARAAILVGVDGLFSMVRKGLVPFPDGRGDEVCESGHTNWNAIMNPGEAGLPYPHPVVSLTYQKEEPPRFFFMIECGHGRILWQVRVDDPGKEYTVAPKKGHGRLGLTGVKQRILDLVADVPDVQPYIAATPEETIFERCLLFRKPLQRYSTLGRRVVLMGDAAHAMHSVRGQGANMTFEDAHCLGLALAAKGVGPAAVRVFERARIPRANLVQWESNTYYMRQFEKNTSHTWALKFLNFQSYVADFHKHEALPEHLL